MDFGRLSAVRLYQASDALLANRDAIEAHLFERPDGPLRPLAHGDLARPDQRLLRGRGGGGSPRPGAAAPGKSAPIARCPPLGLVLDGSGFVRRSQVFAGAVSEDTILPPRLDALGAPKGALVVMDAGGAAEVNLAWLRHNGYRYLVVSRERPRRVDPDLAVALETRSRESVRVHKVDDGDETRLYGYSEARARNEQEHGRALRGAFRGRTGDAQRQPVAPAYPQGARPRLGAHRAHQG